MIKKILIINNMPTSKNQVFGVSSLLLLQQNIVIPKGLGNYFNLVSRLRELHQFMIACR